MFKKQDLVWINRGLEFDVAVYRLFKNVYAIRLYSFYYHYKKDIVCKGDKVNLKIAMLKEDFYSHRDRVDLNIQKWRVNTNRYKDERGLRQT